MYMNVSVPLSFPIYQVREFGVEDACPYMVEFRWDRDGEQSVQALFEKNSPFPSTKSLTLMRSHPFKVVGYVPELNSKIGEYEVRRSWIMEAFLNQCLNCYVHCLRLAPLRSLPRQRRPKSRLKSA